MFFTSLLEAFEVPERRTPAKLSTGGRAALRAAFALATRAEVTVLDEVHLGMDAVTRRAFYDALLADYAAHPRTMILSSHLLEEIQPLVEDVVVLDRGRVVAAGEVDDVRRAHSRGDSLASLTDVLVDLTTPAIAPADPSTGAHR
ncbi:putative ABC transporter ATP-binding protein [Mobilicoccus pelagius]|uniref:Putative ABC transporter ATP-binding protein n=1 Tax=Mobilicoccus pelagius NBRC 104925 TaxID=1089455 RepID=H5UTR0_9MICO|nr:putative ABC transporter ATP-binding protein [Mobilicoccus pelagius]GAB49118.1 putative ABC transporter ATP-binding protein [Mobilicoccus pelagius NBRC 104925]